MKLSRSGDFELAAARRTIALRKRFGAFSCWRVVIDDDS